MDSYCERCDRRMHPADAAQWYRCHACRRGNPNVHRVRTLAMTHNTSSMPGPSPSWPFEVESMDRITRR